MATICTEATHQCPRLSWRAQVTIGLAATAALVTVAVFVVDLPVLYFIRDRELNHYRFLKWLTRPPEVFVILSPFVLLACLVKRWYTRWSWAEKVAVAAAVSTLLTALATLLLKISFGRSGPDIGANEFNPFQLSPTSWSFPSGHTACTLSTMAVVGAAMPRWRLCCWFVPVMVGASLIALTYHFVGDIFGGAFLGWAVGGTIARWFEITTATESLASRNSPTPLFISASP